MRKFLTILLCCVFIVFLTGCGEKESDNNKINCITNPEYCEDDSKYDDSYNDTRTECYVDQETGQAKCEDVPVNGNTSNNYNSNNSYSDYNSNGSSSDYNPSDTECYVDKETGYAVCS